jgi:ribonuclease III
MSLALDDTVGQSVGHRFRRADLLQQALTHRSFGVPHNERLEFLGDGVLNLAIATLIYEKFPAMPEGELSRLRANLVNQHVLADIATALSLGEKMRMGEGEIKTGGRSRPSILADAVESIIGAVYVDAGYDAALAVVKKLFTEKLIGVAEITPTKDAKTALQEWLQGKRHPLPQYMVKRIEGASHQQTFFVECITERPAFKVQGEGASRRAAEQDAASKVMAKIAELT